MKALYRQRESENKETRYIIKDDIAVPECGHGLVSIKVEACGVSQCPLQVYEELAGRLPVPDIPVGHEVVGVVTQVGPGVTGFSVGDQVAGYLPLDTAFSGCAEQCTVDQFHIVHLPNNVSPQVAAASVGDGVRAYTALHSQGHICRGDTVLVMDGASPLGSMAIQLAHHWDAKVLTTASSGEDRSYLESLQSQIAHVIDLDSKTHTLVSSVIEETGGVGVDVIIDNGVRLFSTDEDIRTVGEQSSYTVPHKQELLSCLAAGGTWITSHPKLQLDPPDCQILFLKGASVSFLFGQLWTMAPSKLGVYQHILRDLMQLLSQKTLKPRINQEVSLDQAAAVWATVDKHRLGKVVITPQRRD